ncbi:MAG: rhodanese-like domain-containing protein [Elusimicrobiota bacterium]
MSTTAAKLIEGPVEYFRAKLDYEMTPTLLKTLIDATPRNVFVVDVRGREAYDEGHIPGARSVPIDVLVPSLAALPKDKLLVACDADLACDLSTRAALELAQKGFRVQTLIGGLAEWSRRGYPVESTPPDGPSQAW